MVLQPGARLAAGLTATGFLAVVWTMALAGVGLKIFYPHRRVRGARRTKSQSSSSVRDVLRVRPKRGLCQAIKLLYMARMSKERGWGGGGGGVYIYIILNIALVCGVDCSTSVSEGLRPAACV